MNRMINISLIVTLAGLLHLEGQNVILDQVQKETDLLNRLNSTGVIDLPHQSVNRPELLKIAQLKIDSSHATKTDLADWKRLINNIPELAHLNIKDTIRDVEKGKGLLNTFYRDPYSFLEVNTNEFFLKIDPVLQISYGDDSFDRNIIFQNTRGIKLRGIIDQKIFFAASIFENQQRFYNYIENEIGRISSIPGQGYFKPYQSGIIKNLNGWDFLNANSFLGMNISPSISVQLGHGKHQIGNGMRSLLLSNYANNYFYLQFNTKIWKIHYQNTFTELSSYSPNFNPGNTLIPKKYMAYHYLNLQLNKNLSIGLFESVVFTRENNFEFQYLNPLILYRSVEQFLDSPDNVLIGINLNYNFRRNYQFYGQLMLDELKTSEAFTGNGWWGNKVAYQLGLRAFDVLNIDNLDFQVEHNTARPFTYAHRNIGSENIPVTSYSHSSQPLAHPYGANFRETIFAVNYRPGNKWHVNNSSLFSSYGEDNPWNVGRNILISYEDRNTDYNHVTGQGLNNSIFANELSISYELYPNYFLDVNWLYRRQKIDNSVHVRTNYFGFGFRANMSRHSNLF